MLCVGKGHEILDTYSCNAIGFTTFGNEWQVCGLCTLWSSEILVQVSKHVFK